MPFHQASPMAVVLLTALTFLTGCLGPAIHGNVKDKVMEPQPIIETKTGRALSPARLAADLDGTRVIFLGEIHDHPLQHQRQLEIIEALWARDRKLVIGLELFEHPSQILLDQWTRGLILKDDFKNELEGIFSPDILAVYFPLLEWAGKRRVPLLALNLPRKISALVARNGLTDLSDEQVRALPREIEVGPDEYRQRVAGLSSTTACSWTWKSFLLPRWCATKPWPRPWPTTCYPLKTRTSGPWSLPATNTWRGVRSAGPGGPPFTGGPGQPADARLA